MVLPFIILFQFLFLILNKKKKCLQYFFEIAQNLKRLLEKYSHLHKTGPLRDKAFSKVNVPTYYLRFIPTSSISNDAVRKRDFFSM